MWELGRGRYTTRYMQCAYINQEVNLKNRKLFWHMRQANKRPITKPLVSMIHINIQQRVL